MGARFSLELFDCKTVRTLSNCYECNKKIYARLLQADLISNNTYNIVMDDLKVQYWQRFRQITQNNDATNTKMPGLPLLKKSFSTLFTKSKTQIITRKRQVTFA